MVKVTKSFHEIFLRDNQTRPKKKKTAGSIARRGEPLAPPLLFPPTQIQIQASKAPISFPFVAVHPGGLCLLPHPSLDLSSSFLRHPALLLAPTHGWWQ